MGGATSLYFQTTGLKDSSIAWSAKEVEENRRAELTQNESLKFILKHFYHDSTVPVRFTKKSADPKSPLWIEPSPDVFNEDNSESVVKILRIDFILNILLFGLYTIRVFVGINT